MPTTGISQHIRSVSKACSTQLVGNDNNNWQRVFGDGEEEACDSSGEGGHGRVELREEEGHVGQHAKARAANTPRFTLAAVLANCPELLNAILQSTQFQHVFEAAHESALHAIKELWDRDGLQVDADDLRLSQYAYRQLIDPMTHMWDENM
jgi:predicted ATPase